MHKLIFFFILGGLSLFVTGMYTAMYEVGHLPTLFYLNGIVCLLSYTLFWMYLCEFFSRYFEDDGGGTPKPEEIPNNVVRLDVYRDMRRDKWTA